MIIFITEDTRIFMFAKHEVSSCQVRIGIRAISDLVSSRRSLMTVIVVQN